MKKRLITAIVALLIFIPLVIYGGSPLTFLAYFLGLTATVEILIMDKRILVSPEAIIAYIAVIILITPDRWFSSLPSFLNQTFLFYVMVMLLLLRMVFTKNLFSFSDAGVIAVTALYIGMGFHYFLNARIDGIDTIFYALFIVWSTDTGAYLIGKKFGTHRLAPHISPHKTWEGSFGGSILAMIVGTIWLYYFPVHAYGFVTMFIITIFLSIVSQFGDLVESAIKRHYGVKDSGKILPGHGGILDRFDSLLFVLPVLHLLGII
ncbi:phosphatidate cytidylyltransferase [Acetilactobacillus jinshanensis]|uniref:Phosphatidate cytidylyltransferase n=1 Tax=Acetilactobacillus jinshanensis TaxID=1720083 RepID=A0A4P6ZJN7_9LACO|nr:phosphatidate cytidylyltransferase [Acetilactobacillus jinshanensis]QBP17951.1 phosphatidate cytidylyltransferase [Acetilactobacillus jinshanensis]URL60814.1 phosphatidate cytidylyltransferase [uncultured bacterium]